MSKSPQRHARAKDIFLKACRLPADQRSNYVDSICAGDVSLLEAVERLLACHRSGTLRVNVADKGQLDSTELRRAIESVLADAADDRDDPTYVPGTMLANRYRIVALLGQGGMGQVYRADDLTLGVRVALKFLPMRVSRDPIWLDRLRHEVNVARRVAHPNICRVHDIVVDQPRPFIVMEYVDGEDLATLLKRIGRLPYDKAVEVAQQLCAGLDAIHAKGLLHRDLKPANIMLDARGQIRITDFGLAGTIGQFEPNQVRAGTPPYMSPEQITGRGVDRSSDIYALGLVLYELFCGQPAFVASGIDEYRQLHESATPEAMSQRVSGIHLDVDRTIMACLEKSPDARPPSALAVSAGLPGGDLLAAALAAGRVPSPDTVASANIKDGLGRGHAITMAVVFVVMLGAAVGSAGKLHAVRIAGATKSPAVLTQTARDLITQLGFPLEQHHSATGYISHVIPPADSYLAQLFGDLNSYKLAGQQALLFWYRQGPEPLLPRDAANLVLGEARTTLFDPPATQQDMLTVVLNQQGQLVFFEAVPAINTSPINASIDWQSLLTLAGFEKQSLVQDTPLLGARYHDETRIAWASPADAASPIRIEGSAIAGQPIQLAVLAPAPTEPWHGDWWARALRIQRTKTFLLVVLVVAALPLVRRNRRTGTTDGRGATRLGIAIVTLRMAQWLLRGTHTSALDDELFLLGMAALHALGEGTIVWLFYAALEPHVRRYWPQTLVSWQRVNAGRFADRLVGRDLLTGATMGAFWMAALHFDRVLVTWLGVAARSRMHVDQFMTGLLSGRLAVAQTLAIACDAVYTSLSIVLLLALLRVVLRRTWLAGILVALMISPLYVPRGEHPVVSALLVGVAGIGLAVWIAMRCGLLAITVGVFVVAMLSRFPLTLSAGAWYADLSFYVLTLVSCVAATGLYLALRPQPSLRLDRPR